MAKAEPVRRYAYLDSIAIQRQAAQIKRIEAEVKSVEAARVAFPLNPAGRMDDGMVGQIAQRVAEKRETLKAAKELSGDARVMAYCQREIAEADMPEWAEVLNPDGSPLRRGGYV